MSKFMKNKVISSILKQGLVPVFYNSDLEVAKKIVTACYEGGSKIVEFTNRGDYAYHIFNELSRWCDKEFPDLILGVGTIIDHATAAIYINNGANFIVGPIYNEKIAKICNRRNIMYSPGCGSLSEISTAQEMGCDIIKVFPGTEVGGPNFIKKILAPCPWLKLMPTGGVDTTRESIFEWIESGASALGIGSRLIRKDFIEANNFNAISEHVEQVLLWIKEAKGIPIFLGLEHVGIYPTDEIKGKTISDWYIETFGFNMDEGSTAFHIPSRGPGEIEISKKQVYEKCHIAIKVSNFDLACEYLKRQGIKLEEPIIGNRLKAVFLKNPDPSGNIVHLIYRI